MISTMMTENNISYVLLIIAVIWMLFAARRDHSSYKKGDHNDLKSVIVSIGVLGTFVGIALGLWRFDTDNISQSVPNLLDGLKLAFMTSIAGMLISIILTTIQRDKTSGGNDEVSILNAINQNLNKINDQIGGSMGELQEEMDKNRKVLERGFGEFKTEAQTISSTLENFPTIETISQLIGNKLDGIKNLEEIKEQIGGARVELQEEMGKSRKILDQGLGKFNEEVQAIGSTLGTFPTAETMNQLIGDKLDGIQNLEEIKEQIKGTRIELHNEMDKNRKVMNQGFGEFKEEVHTIGSTLETFPTVETINQFKNEIHEEQVDARRFFEEQFTTTNDSLKEAIDVLSRGATEEIIQALENVISDFNKNLTDQFGENFKELNSAVVNLLEWQKQHKDIIEKDGNLLSEIRGSLSSTSSTLESIAQRNSEVMGVYEELKSLITTYDSQVAAVNSQLERYKQIAEDANKAFEVLSSGFEKVQTGIGTQSEAIATLTREISTQLPESLGQLESTLVALTSKFGEDYQSFLDNYKKLIA